MLAIVWRSWITIPSCFASYKNILLQNLLKLLHVFLKEITVQQRFLPDSTVQQAARIRPVNAIKLLYGDAAQFLLPGSIVGLYIIDLFSVVQICPFLPITEKPLYFYIASRNNAPLFPIFSAWYPVHRRKTASAHYPRTVCWHSPWVSWSPHGLIDPSHYYPLHPLHWIHISLVYPCENSALRRIRQRSVVLYRHRTADNCWSVCPWMFSPLFANIPYLYPMCILPWFK